jgi:hypothetical protein
VHPATPLSIRRRIRRLEPCVGPTSRDLLIDELDLRDAKVLAGDTADSARKFWSSTPYWSPLKTEPSETSESSESGALYGCLQIPCDACTT